jgi:hypothetical protein
MANNYLNSEEVLAQIAKAKARLDAENSFYQMPEVAGSPGPLSPEAFKLSQDVAGAQDLEALIGQPIASENVGFEPPKEQSSLVAPGEFLKGLISKPQSLEDKNIIREDGKQVAIPKTTQAEFKDDELRTGRFRQAVVDQEAQGNRMSEEASQILNQIITPQAQGGQAELSPKDIAAKVKEIREALKEDGSPSTLMQLAVGFGPVLAGYLTGGARGGAAAGGIGVDALSAMSAQEQARAKQAADLTKTIADEYIKGQVKLSTGPMDQQREMAKLIATKQIERLIQQGKTGDELVRDAKKAWLDAQRDIYKVEQETPVKEGSQIRQEGVKQTGRTSLEAQRQAGREKLEGMKANTKEGRYQVRDLSDSVNRYNKDAVVQKAATGLGAAQTAKELLSSGNVVAAEAAKTQIARMSGDVGALSNQDINRYGGSKALTDKIDQLWSSASSGKLTAENKALLMDIVATFERNNKRIMEERADYHAEQSSKILGRPKDEIRNLLMPSSAPRDQSGVSKEDKLKALRAAGLVK